MRKILLITTNYPYGFEETFIHLELKHLSKYHNIHIIPMYKNGEMRDISELNNVTVHEPLLDCHPKKEKIKLIKAGIIPKSFPAFILKGFFRAKTWSSINNLKIYFTYILLYQAMIKKISKQKLNLEPKDLLYLYWGDQMSMLSYYFKRKYKLSIVMRLHSVDLYEERAGYIPFRSSLAKYIDAFLPISENGAKYLIRNYNIISADKVKVKRLGVYGLDIEDVNSYSSDNKVVSLYTCSNIVKVKRVDLLIDALKLLPFKVEWHHIGTGTLEKQIKTYAEGLQSNIKVIWHGQLTNKQVLEIYKVKPVDIFINVSSWEGIPVSIMEAISFGIPVIATDVGGTKEIVNDDIGILLSSNPTPQEIADAISYFACIKKGIAITPENKFYNKQQGVKVLSYTDYRINARARYEEKYSAERNFKDFSEFLEKF